MKPSDLYRLPVVGDPRLSPDGSLVAFTVTQADEETNDYRSAIWIVPSDGSSLPRRLTWSGQRDAMPRWSPAGASLAFISNRHGWSEATPTNGGATQLYVLPMAGGEPHRLTDVAEGVSAVAWSPDGTSLAFVSTVRGPAYDEDDETRRAPRDIARIGFKSDGRGFIHDRPTHVFVVPADGSAPPRQITDGDFDHADPAWSPDGTCVVVSAYREDDHELSSDVDLYVFSVADGSARRLTDGGSMVSKPSWSPDGQWIAARLFPETATAPWNVQIVLVDVSDGSRRVLTTSLDMQCGPYAYPREPIWSNDRLLFTAESAGNCHLYAVDVPEGKPEPLIEGDLAVADVDAVGDVIVHAVSSPTRPAELRCGDAQLTHVSDEFCRSVALQAPQRFLATSPDGSEVEAWAMAPARAVAGERYPALLFVHGGPFAQYGNTFLDEFHVATGAGYAVVYANPRGSSGYGDDWGRAIRGPISGGPGWGTVDLEDLMAVTDEAVRRFDFVDPERLGVLGGSYGGFMTAWIVSHTDRFKAACAERGIYNVYSAIGTSDGLWSSGNVWGGDPYEHEDLMMRVSPITHADNIRTPLLLIHSDEDHRCPVEQAEQLFTRLRLLQREVELVRFPHGTHDLSRGGPPRQRVFRFERILDWFDRHL